MAVIKALRNRGSGLVFLCAAVLFMATVDHMKAVPRKGVRVEMQVALPLFVQVFLAAGDRFLAANLASIRALVVDTRKMRNEDYHVLAKVQVDASWLNPAHEDNYYIAAAILSWNEQVDPAQTVLARATKARPFDYQPAFLYAFNQLHFKGDAVGASAWMREAAEHLPEGQNRLHMQNLAAIWLDRAEDSDLAIRVVEAMAEQAKRQDFQRYLRTRVVRLRALRDLRLAAAVFEQRFARAPKALDELVSTGCIKEIPSDPFGFGFALDGQGRITLRKSPPVPGKNE